MEPSSDAAEGNAAAASFLPKRVLLHLDDRALEGALGSALSVAGFEVRSVRMFPELVAWLIFYSNSAALVFQPSAIETFRKAMLREIRRVAPTTPLIALVPTMTPEVERDMQDARVAHVLATDAQVDMVQVVRDVLVGQACS